MAISLINFKTIGSSAATGNWNNLAPASGNVIADLIDSAGASTGWGVDVGGSLPTAETLGVNSVGSGDASWVDQSQTSFAVWTYNGITGTITFTGLNDLATYDFDVYASRDATGDRTLEFSPDGFTTTYSINGAGNTSAIATAAGVSPASGSITLSFTDAASAITGNLAAMRVTENAATDSTAPVLSTPTGTKTGSTTATGSVSTDEGNGTLYYYASTNSSETAATIKASGSSQVVSATGSQAVSFTGLTASTTYYAHYVQDDAAANESSVANSTSFTTDAADVTAPVLSTPTGTKTGTTTASGTVTTDEGNGTLYFYASTNATETAATIKASGASQAVSVSGSQSVSFTGLTPATTYYAHYVQDDAAANESNVVDSTSFTTDAAAATLNSIDADNNVQAGQAGVIIATTGVDPASVTQTVTLGGEALTVTAWTNVGGNAQITVTIPAAIALKWGRTDLTLSVTDDAGTYTLGGITLSAPTGWESVAFTTAPNEATTESFYEYAKTDATIGSYTLVAGDVLAWTTSTGLTVDGQTIPTVSPAATVTGSYKVWKELTSTWTAESTYTITDLGVFVEPAVLSSASASYSSATSAIATVNTDSITGTLYGYVSTNATELAATIKASGSSQTVTSSTESMVFTGLTTDTTYYVHFVQNNGQDSNVITTNSFVPQVSTGNNEAALVQPLVKPLVSTLVH